MNESRAAHAFDTQAPGALELALHAKVLGSETAVRVISDLMRVVGIDSYDRTLPLGGLLADALVLTLFDGWEHRRSATAIARADANAELRPARDVRRLRQSRWSFDDTVIVPLHP